MAFLKTEEVDIIDRKFTVLQKAIYALKKKNQILIFGLILSTRMQALKFGQQTVAFGRGLHERPDLRECGSY